MAGPFDRLKDEAQERLADARAQKALVRNDIENAYYFTAPRRLRSASSQSNQTTKTGDEKELATSMGFEVADDFMTMLIESFMPQSARWAERLPDPSIEGAMRGKIAGEARAQDEKIFQMIRASNFHAELARQGVPDAAIGVIAMVIKDEAAWKPLQCLGVPIRELEINTGPDGRIDDRFIVRKTKYRHVRKLIGGAIALPKDVAAKIDDKKTRNDSVEVRWGWWRLWDRDDDEYWQHVVMVGDEVVLSEELKGEGSCALVVGRFGATPDFAWPDGPTIKALPEYLQLDELNVAVIESIDFSLRPPFAHDDDGVLNFEEGIEPGMAYPRRPAGGNKVFEPLFDPRSIEPGLFETQRVEQRIRRLHYVDFPEQRGKTPPTLGQWLDEMVQAQKKIGTPGYAFWREFPFDAFNRFRYLAEKRGVVRSIMVNGQPMNLSAYNPAQRAQENQEVLTATRYMQIGGAAFPQTFQVAVDDMLTMRNIKEKLGDKLVALRAPEEIAAAVQQVSQLAGVGGPKAPGGLPMAANQNAE